MKTMPTIAALLALMFPIPALAQDEEPEVIPCKECDDVGLLPCREHPGKGKRAELERHVLYCSVVDGCADCRGVGWTDCEACANPTAEEWCATRLAEVPERRKKHSRYSKIAERTLRVAESEHFVLVCELKPMKVGRSKADEHQLLHIYLDRLEALFDDYCTIFGIKKTDFEAKSEILLWSDYEEHKKVSTELCSYFWEDIAVYQRGAKGICSIHAPNKFLKDDATIYRYLLHHVVHGLMNLQRPSAWLGDMPGGWADSGLAHWFEEKYFGIVDGYCFPEATPPSGIKSKKWRAGVRKLVASEGVPDLTVLSFVRNRAMTGEQHAYGFSLIDYLMDRDRKKLNLLLKRLRGTTPLRDAVKEVYGLKLPELQDAWKEWVLETYPRR